MAAVLARMGELPTAAPLIRAWMECILLARRLTETRSSAQNSVAVMMRPRRNQRARRSLPPCAGSRTRAETTGGMSPSKRLPSSGSSHSRMGFAPNGRLMRGCDCGKGRLGSYRGERAEAAGGRPPRSPKAFIRIQEDFDDACDRKQAQTSGPSSRESLS